jgi:hypothetical protein
MITGIRQLNLRDVGMIEPKDDEGAEEERIEPPASWSTGRRATSYKRKR